MAINSQQFYSYTMNQYNEEHHFQKYQELKAKKMQFKLNQDAIRFIQKPKYLYPLFNLFELQMNRFHSLPQFNKVAAEIISFNHELEDWKINNKQIKNILLTYHLYQNLFSRIKYTSSLVIDRTEAKRAYVDIAKWFFEQKPKIRNKAPEKQEAQPTASFISKETEAQIDNLLVTNISKRELKPYEAMARTSHPQFFPPTERLLEYKRKDFLEGFHQQPATQRRTLSVSTLSKGITRYRGSLATTRTSFLKTMTQSLSKEQKVEPAVAPFEIQQNRIQNELIPQLLDNTLLEDIAKQKKVQQEELLQQNILQVTHEQDQQDGQEEVQSELQRKEGINYRKYRENPTAQEEVAAEENIKDNTQSTLRRILKQKEEAIRRKMEELTMAQQISNWTAVKSKKNTEQHRKLERMHLANKFNKLEYVPRNFEERQSIRKREIPQFQTFYRSKSLQTCSVEQELQKGKINTALKIYGKYINHIDINPVQPQTEEEKEELRVMRSTSLTSLCRQGKKAPFSSIIEKCGVENYNQEALSYMTTIKERLAKTAISVEKKQILQGLGVADVSKMDLPDQKLIFPLQKTMFNNPFFKDLYKTKTKKKKK